MTPLHLAGRFKSSGPVVSLLINAGSDIEARNSDQYTPLHLAAKFNPEAMKQLIASNAKVNVLSSGDYSPLWFAAVNNQRDSVVALCKAGADPDLGDSPLTSVSIGSEMKAFIKRLCK